MTTAAIRSNSTAGTTARPARAATRRHLRSGVTAGRDRQLWRDLRDDANTETSRDPEVSAILPRRHTGRRQFAEHDGWPVPYPRGVPPSRRAGLFTRCGGRVAHLTPRGVAAARLDDHAGTVPADNREQVIAGDDTCQSQQSSE